MWEGTICIKAICRCVAPSTPPQQYKQTNKQKQRENNMKIRNLAFCGVMASILGVSGAYATDATIIASKAYVDARDNTKQDNADRVTTTWDAAVTAGVDNSEVKYPSMKTLKDVKDGLEDSISTNVTNNAYTANALDSTAQTDTNKAKLAKVEAIQNTAQRAQTGSTLTKWNTTSGDGANDDKLPTTKAVTQQISQVESELTTAITTGDNAINNTFEKGMNSDTERAYNAWAANPSTETASALTGAIATDTDLDNVVSDSKSGHANKIPRNSNIQKGIAYMKGNGIVNHTKNVDETALTENLETASTAWKKEFTDKVADDHVPTVAAVEARVKQAESNATGMKDTAPSATWDNNTLTIVTGNNAGNKTDKLATSAQVNTSVSALKSYADYKIGNTAMGTTATTLTGAIAEVKATADGALKDVTQGTGDGEAYVALVKDGTNVKGTKGILTYSGALNHKLSEINTNGGDGSSNCKVGSPCVLTMVMNGSTPVYEWTNMETDGLNADL